MRRSAGGPRIGPSGRANGARLPRDVSTLRQIRRACLTAACRAAFAAFCAHAPRRSRASQAAALDLDAFRAPSSRANRASGAVFSL